MLGSLAGAYRASSNVCFTYFAVITVYQKWMILPVKDQPQDGLHGFDGDLFLLCTLHVENVVSYTILVDEGLVALRKILPNQRTRYQISRWNTLRCP